MYETRRIENSVYCKNFGQKSKCKTIVFVCYFLSHWIAWFSSIVTLLNSFLSVISMAMYSDAGKTRSYGKNRDKNQNYILQSRRDKKWPWEFSKTRCDYKTLDFIYIYKEASWETPWAEFRMLIRTWLSFLFSSILFQIQQLERHNGDHVPIIGSLSRFIPS